MKMVWWKLKSGIHKIGGICVKRMNAVGLISGILPDLLIELCDQYYNWLKYIAAYFISTEGVW